MTEILLHFLGQGVCDGAAAVVVASGAAVKQYNLTPLARLVAYGISGIYVTVEWRNFWLGCYCRLYSFTFQNLVP